MKSIMYNALSVSSIDSGISLHPDQLEILRQIINNNALIISAPTSFGKTFCIFEYIARYHPYNVVLIVPTLALVDEYMKKIIKRYAHSFAGYSVHTNLDPLAEYDFTKKNIFILTHDRVIQPEAFSTLDAIDFLVIDEVYKLETDMANDRVLVLNMAYHYLSRRAKKYVLLAPFLGGVEDCDMLEKEPVFYHSNYSSVVNEVRVRRILREKDRKDECRKLVDSLPSDEKTLIYFPTVSGMSKYIRDVIGKLPDSKNLSSSGERFVSWAKDEIHDEWSVVRAMEKGYLVHNGQIPRGTRQFQLDEFEHGNAFNRMLCTSTLLEGVNTTARSIIITKPARGSRNGFAENFTAFDFFNLVGRTGRLNQHLIGTAYYIQGPGDPEYHREDAVRSIRFEVIDDSVDIDMQTDNFADRPEVIGFLEELGITIDDYIDNIGSRYRFETVKKLHEAYLNAKSNLIMILKTLAENDRMGRFHLVLALLKIYSDRFSNLDASIVNELLSLRRTKLRKVIDGVARVYNRASLDDIISRAIRYKYGFIEHEFYGKTKIIEYFLRVDDVDERFVEELGNRITHNIDALYYSSSPAKKTMLDLGIYERDVDKLAKIIGEDFSDARGLIQALKDNRKKLSALSYMSLYVIDGLIS